MVSYKNFTEIPAWRLSHDNTLIIYKTTKNFPKEEIYGITSQLRRSASSIAANITEGFYRNTTKELITFLYNARGSCGETLYHLILSHDLRYINDSDFTHLSRSYNYLGKQISNWINSLKKKIK